MPISRELFVQILSLGWRLDQWDPPKHHDQVEVGWWGRQKNKQRRRTRFRSLQRMVKMLWVHANVREACFGEGKGLDQMVWRHLHHIYIYRVFWRCQSERLPCYAWSRGGFRFGWTKKTRDLAFRRLRGICFRESLLVRPTLFVCLKVLWPSSNVLITNVAVTNVAVLLNSVWG